MADSTTWPPAPHVLLRIVAAMLVLVGVVGTLGVGSMLVPEWRAAHGGGVTGTFTLTEPLGCDRRKPPDHQCDWFGDFRGEDGRTVRQHMEWSEYLPASAQIGDTLAARHTGSLAQIYPADGDTHWQLSAKIVAGCVAALLAGLVLLEPWMWRTWLRRRRYERRDGAPGDH
ncbi:hypothetical protein [Actinoplanes regularis]|uniref:hypothetical protein n=1 Tax=Actinoplanes regularis TaxID=52697 RepID=UPI002555BED4|nr:hypothetical protein [Actinoplanes regularis]GLW27694.1 hypothetical protein Areg01_06340 [Actinoplanes regularis]